MTEPSAHSFDTPMAAISGYCLAEVAKLLGVPVSTLRDPTFQIVQLTDGSWAGRISLAAVPVSAAAFEPGERG